MDKNYDYIENKKINQIILPATNHSCSYNINYNKSIGSTKTNLIRICGKNIKYINYLINKLILKQQYTIKQQLNNGVRVLHIQISYYKNNFYATSTFILDLLENVLFDIIEFLNKNRREIIILLFTNDPIYIKSMDNYIFFSYIKKYLDFYLYKNIYCNTIPFYRDMIDKNERIFLIHDLYNNYDCLWKKEYLNTRFINTNDELTLLNYMNNSILFFRQNDFNLNFIKFIIKPKLINIFKKSSNNTHKLLKKFIIMNENKIDKISSIFLDNINEDIIKYIILLNAFT